MGRQIKSSTCVFNYVNYRGGGGGGGGRASILPRELNTHAPALGSGRLPKLLDNGGKEKDQK